jgi:DNA polymerase-3 subunit epsilon
MICAVRFSIDLSRRTKHGALLDAELLAEVYVELTGKRQARLGLIDVAVNVATVATIAVVRARPAPLSPRLTDTERAAHLAFVGTLGEKAIWRDYLPAGA